MNTLRRNQTIRIAVSMICILCLSVSCKTTKEKAIIKSITKGVNVETENYYFSEDADIKIGNEKYSLRSKIEYNDSGEASKLLVYYPEGVVTYTQKELIEDEKILPSYGYSFKCSYIYVNNELQDSSGKVILFDKLEEDILRSKMDNRVTLYYLK